MKKNCKLVIAALLMDIINLVFRAHWVKIRAGYLLGVKDMCFCIGVINYNNWRSKQIH